MSAGWDALRKGAEFEAEWNERFESYRAEHPELAAEFERRLGAELPRGWKQHCSSYIESLAEKGQTVATRKASQNTLNSYGAALPEFIGGSADLTGSNLTNWSGSKMISKDSANGNYIHFGVREFGMSAIMNGITLHGGFIPYGGTFLMFSEYARNALRMAALMKIRSIFVYSHDSIGLGEDGPTHQAVEQAATLRLIPNMSLWRPCDDIETAVAWQAAIERLNGPTCLLLSRQNLRHHARTRDQIANIRRGGYVLVDGGKTPDAIIIATGSEVSLAADAAELLAKRGLQVRVVSMPSTDVFEAQDAAYREAVLPRSITARVAVEAGVTDGWVKYVGFDGKVIGINSFGESAPAAEVFKHFGLTTDHIMRAVEELVPVREVSLAAEVAGD